MDPYEAHESTSAKAEERRCIDALAAALGFDRNATEPRGLSAVCHAVCRQPRVVAEFFVWALELEDAPVKIGGTTLSAAEAKDMADVLSAVAFVLRNIADELDTTHRP